MTHLFLLVNFSRSRRIVLYQTVQAVSRNMEDAVRASYLLLWSPASCNDISCLCYDLASLLLFDDTEATEHLDMCRLDEMLLLHKLFGAAQLIEHLVVIIPRNKLLLLCF